MNYVVLRHLTFVFDVFHCDWPESIGKAKHDDGEDESSTQARLTDSVDLGQSL